MTRTKDSRTSPIIRLIPPLPFSFAFGGLEIQCLRTRDALRDLGMSVSLLDPYIVDTDYDVIHIFGTRPGVYDLIQHVSDKPVVLTALFGSTPPSTTRTIAKRALTRTARLANQLTIYEMTRSTLSSVSQVICLTELDKTYIMRSFGIQKSSISVIPNGVSDEFFSPDPMHFINRYGVKDFVLFVGNIIRRKNPHLLAEAVRGLGYPCVFIGPTVAWERDYGQFFESIVHRESKIVWIRDLRFNDPLLVSAYGAASVFCLPSASESQSLSALEALASGTPVILGDEPYAYQRPFSEVRKCKHGSVQSIRNCIVEILEEPRSAPVPKLSEDFRWSSVAARLAEIYRGLWQ